MIPIIDTHQHLVLDRWPYSWTNGIPALAGETFDATAYTEASRGTGITHTIFMETSPDDPHWREETKVACAMGNDTTSPIVGAIINCRPEEPEGFDVYLEETAHPKRVGLRRTLHGPDDTISQSPHFRRNIRLLAQHSLTFDMCYLARQLPIALDLARECPDVRLILDHCGVPDIKAGSLDPWRGYIRNLAELPNTYAKVSGVLAYCDLRNATIDAVRPYVEHVIESFGWDRVVWGGDWPVCLSTSNLQEWVAVTREIVAKEDEANQRKLFFDNALEVYRLSL